MASLKDYFVLDAKTVCIEKEFYAELGNSTQLKMMGRLHLDFESNASYVSFYVERNDFLDCPAAAALTNLGTIFNLKNDLKVQGGMEGGEEAMKSDDMIFAGRIFVYDENPPKNDCDQHIRQQAAAQGHFIQFRRQAYADARAKFEKPLAFISHDSRDKDLVAKPIVEGLTKLACPVWYDEYSLNLGDNLRRSIEKGIKGARKCIVVLSPNFMANSGWTKMEFDTVFMKDLHLGSESIIPIWHGVRKDQIYEYCPALLNFVGLPWPDKSESDYENKLKVAINRLHVAINK
ncbi:toll/interleukin-1 receptor domain-containing protein [Chryseolinea lacunae]|uniref:Toll/interleukin-1 receptor domain-containing protein n=1 Tax=Chryseolinea lacunae TaxID=2801331 RepID=A0ABS1L2F5_9BACT|nr:toll/interleukin-1 receptor domain-containing protein [Chryseolinea lacunae]MBL0745819.1 toll/interleukin-1 receptor domain-containing protein [Chryseolinea lacunae]